VAEIDIKSCRLTLKSNIRRGSTCDIRGIIGAFHCDAHTCRTTSGLKKLCSIKVIANRSSKQSNVLASKRASLYFRWKHRVDQHGIKRSLAKECGGIALYKVEPHQRRLIHASIARSTCKTIVYKASNHRRALKGSDLESRESQQPSIAKETRGGIGNRAYPFAHRPYQWQSTESFGSDGSKINPRPCAGAICWPTQLQHPEVFLDD
jgi:hypothetical protein